VSSICYTNTYSTESGELEVKDNIVLWEFKNVFLEEVARLPLKRDLEFSIDLVSVSVSTSRVPYRMTVPDLVELKMHLKEMMDRGYIRMSVSLWGALTLFVKKKDGTLILCIDY
jgi:hypothetical protein